MWSKKIFLMLPQILRIAEKNLTIMKEVISLPWLFFKVLNSYKEKYVINEIKQHLSLNILKTCKLFPSTLKHLQSFKPFLFAKE